MTRQTPSVRWALLPAFFLLLRCDLPAEDCNSNGVDDAVETSNGASPDCNHNSVPDACELLEVNAGLVRQQYLPDSPERIRLLDLDGKGALDVAYVSRTVPFVAVEKEFLFNVLPTYVRLGENRSPEDLGGGDLDGDGDGDLAVLLGASGGVAVVLNRGNGSFGDNASPPPPTVTVPGTPASLAVADLDGDGRADLALPDPQSGRIAFLLSRGSGDFSEPVMVGALTSSRWAIAGDLDGDGDQDLVVTSEAGAVLLANTGRGTFTPLAIDGFGPTGNEPVLGDLDRDGRLELVATGDFHARVAWNAGRGVFTTTTHRLRSDEKTGLPEARQALAVVDLDADGKLDLLAQGVSSTLQVVVAFLRNLSDREFAGGIDLPADSRVGSRPAPRALAAADMDLDGRTEIYLSTSESFQLYQQGKVAYGRDCNQNQIPDDCDLAASPALDCDRDGVPDSCQNLEDCNQNRLSDLCEFLGGLEQDCDLNGRLDSCEVGPATDLNRNGILDVCEQPSTSMFSLGFEGPEIVEGRSGEMVKFDVYSTLTTRDNPLPDGPQGWSLSIPTWGGSLKRVTVKGLHVSTRFDDDGVPATPLVDPYDLDLGNAGFRVAQLGARSTRRNEVFDRLGAISAVVLHQTQKMVLQPENTQRIVKLELEALVPFGADPHPVSLWYENGLHGEQPVNNVITFGGASTRPSGSLHTVLVQRFQPFIRCDANSDGQNDITDAVFILTELFIPDPVPHSPCPRSADCNGDATEDISDGIYALSHLFLDGPPPPAPYPACGSMGGNPSLPCPQGSTTCP